MSVEENSNSNILFLYLINIVTENDYYRKKSEQKILNIKSLQFKDSDDSGKLYQASA